ncbi:MAG TPA: Gfo/Idh/MocA family oxidoreductase [Bordetella sp.]|uniref:Gfo/Idh/MocA family protein n=1 Tax=Bordetella sp. TaxID=28081 RepID=UPI002ED684AC
MTTPLRLGIIGLGRAFSLMLPTFLNDERLRLVTACDPRPEARARFAEDFGGTAFEDAQSVVADPNVEAVYIASPHQFHAEHTRLAAVHGKHVLVEKPMALSLDECDAMIAACDAAGVNLVIGHCHSFDTPYLHARDLIRGGEFGAVRMIHALNYTDYLYRPRRPEELVTAQGGGAVFSQAAHQVDIARMLAGERPTRLRAALGRWDPTRPTEGAYCALLWFESGAYASLSYNGYGHFDSDEWMQWTGEMGNRKNPDDFGQARRKLATLGTPEEEAGLKAAGTYGGSGFALPPRGAAARPAAHQHFGAIVVSCERADLRPMADGIWIYGDQAKEFRPLPAPAAPRLEVIDELFTAVRKGQRPLHDGRWAKATLEICLAMLASSRAGEDVPLRCQA